MIGGFPKRPAGSTPEAIYMQGLHDHVTSFSKRQNVDGMPVNKTTRGSYVLPEPQKPGRRWMFFKGDYNPDEESYSVGDVVRVDPDNDYATTNGGPCVPGVYVCRKNDPDKDSNFPLNPLQDGGEDDYWAWLATWPSQIIVCNSETNIMETWLIDGQKKPEITADSTRVKADSTVATADS